MFWLVGFFYFLVGYCFVFPFGKSGGPAPLDAHNPMGEPPEFFPNFHLTCPTSQKTSSSGGICIPSLPPHTFPCLFSPGITQFFLENQTTSGLGMPFIHKMGNPGMLRAFWRSPGADPWRKIPISSREPPISCPIAVQMRGLEFPQRIPAADFPVLGRGSSFRRALKHPRASLGIGDDNPNHNHIIPSPRSFSIPRISMNSAA